MVSGRTFVSHFDIVSSPYCLLCLGAHSRMSRDVIGIAVALCVSSLCGMLMFEVSGTVGTDVRLSIFAFSGVKERARSSMAI